VGFGDICDPQEDAGEPTNWDKYEHVHRVSKMRWYINIGDDMQRDKRTEFTFCRRFDWDYNYDDLVFTDELVISKEKVAPKYPKTGLTHVNCTIKTDFRNVPRTLFRRMASPDGQPYFSISYKLVITTEAANMTFSSEVNGETLGHVDVDYN